MSSSDDSETAEWEREQMLRGTQSRRPKCQQPRFDQTTDIVDASVAKKHVNQKIEKTEGLIESIKKNIGSTKLEIAKSEKRIDAFKKHLEKLESSNTFFEELALSNGSSEILELFEKYRSMITKLPHDQKEMIDLLEKKIKDTELSMDIDQ